MGCQTPAHAEGLGQRFRRTHAGEHGCQRPRGIDLVCQGTGAAVGRRFGGIARLGGACGEQRQPALGELIQGVGILLQGIHAHGFEAEIQHHLHGRGPASVHMELLGEPGMLVETRVA